MKKSFFFFFLVISVISGKSVVSVMYLIYLLYFISKSLEIDGVLLQTMNCSKLFLSISLTQTQVQHIF